jgi:hypothetical protein
MNKARPQDVVDYIDYLFVLKNTCSSYQLIGIKNTALYYKKHNVQWMCIQNVYDFELYDFYKWCVEREETK